MHSTSPQQWDAMERGGLPSLDRVRDDVWALAQPMPGGHLAYSFSYLLRDTQGGVHVIDPGWDSDANWERLIAALAVVAPGTAGADAVAGITGTHLHPDHVGMAARLREASGAPLALHGTERHALEQHSTRRPDPDAALRKLEEWGVPLDRRAGLAEFVDRSPAGLALAVDRTVGDDDRLTVPGFRADVMATPGHTAGHICLRDDDRGLLFTGDHVLPTVFPGLGLGGESPSNPLADYVESIRRIRSFPGHEALPGHGYRFLGLAERAAACMDHQLERAREVAAILGEERGSGGGPGVWDIASRLTWTAGWSGLDGFRLLSALSQTEMHRDFVRTHGLPTS